MSAKDLVPEIVRALIEVQTGTEGVAKAYEYVPNAIQPFPCFINYYERSEYEWPRIANGMREAVHIIRALAVVALQANTADAERIGRPLVGAFVDRLDQHKRLDGLVTSAEVIEAAVRNVEYGPVTFQQGEAAQQYLGITFDVGVRTMESVTYAGGD